MFANSFPNQFSQHVQENDGVEVFGEVIEYLVMLGNNDGQ